MNVTQLGKLCKGLRFVFRTRLTLPWSLRATMHRISRGHTPILVGPWLSEVGFELLYWIPFVRRLFHDYALAPERVIVVSRGGTLPWYCDIAKSYFEILDHVSPPEFAERNKQREQRTGGKRQLAVSDFDRHIVQLAAERLGLRRFDLVHPAWMYELFGAFWCGWMDVHRLMAMCEHQPITERLDRPKGLPFSGSYAAVKFYFSDCFPDTEANRRFVRQIITRVSRAMPVVLLNTGLQLDDHRDAGPDGPEMVFDASHLMKPANNLTVQTALVAHADVLFCTYGGFSYLGPLLGKPTFSFWSEPNFVSSHLQVAHEALNKRAKGRLVVMPTDSLDLLWEWHAKVHGHAA